MYHYLNFLSAGVEEKGVNVVIALKTKVISATNKVIFFPFCEHRGETLLEEGQ